MPTTKESILSLISAVESACADRESILALHDDALRIRLREAGAKLSRALEIPTNTIHRLGDGPMQMATARIGTEYGIFKRIAEAPEGSALTVAELANKTGMDPLLMKRFLRYYQSVGMVDQPEEDGFTANHITRTLGSQTGEDGVHFYHESICPAYTAFPSFLRAKGLINPTNPIDSPWQVAHNNPLHPFAWMAEHPEHQAHFIQWMAVRMDGIGHWTDVLDWERDVTSTPSTPETVLFVDVGGAMGHQCMAFRKKWPELKGRVILQDLPAIIAQGTASPLPGFADANIERQPHDFFEPQPVKGAQAYYFANILHDWPDHKCVEILGAVKAGMNEDSVVLVDDAVLPVKGTRWIAAHLDLGMAALLSATERSREDWEKLFAEAGFEIRKVLTFSEDFERSLLIAAPKKA